MMTDVDKCPTCGSSYVEGGQVDIEGEYALQRCYCTECETEWTDYFRHISREIIHKGE